MSSIKLSVVIGTYNQKDKLKIVLESLFTQSLSPDLYEIIVVDSMSNDGTDQMIKTLATGNESRVTINYIRQKNSGRPGARNRGIEEAKGEIIFITDADMLADTNLLQEHLNAHEKYKDTAFEGLTYNLKTHSPVPRTQDPYIKEKLKPFQKLRFSYFLTGNLSIPKNIIKKAGMFDTDFAGYGWEDIELGYRLSKLGIPLRYLPSAVNYHMHPVSQAEMYERKYHMGQSAAIFYKKHPNLEIKLFLGINPIAQGVYGFIKAFPRLKKLVEARGGYLWEEFRYREGFYKYSSSSKES